MNSILGKLFHLAKNGISEIQSWDYCYYILWWYDISLYNVYFEKQSNATPPASLHYFIIPSSRGKRGEKKWPGLMNFYKFAWLHSLISSHWTNRWIYVCVFVCLCSRRVKLRSSTLVGGNRRRSPRISGRDSWKSEPDSDSRYKLEKPAPSSSPSTTRDRIKRKRHKLHAVSSSITEVSQVNPLSLFPLLHSFGDQ